MLKLVSMSCGCGQTFCYGSSKEHSNIVCCEMIQWSLRRILKYFLHWVLSKINVQSTKTNTKILKEYSYKVTIPSHPWFLKFLEFHPIRKQIDIAAILNFKMKRKSYKILRTNQDTFLPSLVSIGQVVCEKNIKM